MLEATTQGLYYLSPEQAAEMSIVAFSGKKNSGKSTMGRYVIENYGACPEAMARHLKADAVAFEGLPVGEVYGPNKSPATRRRLEQKGHDESRLVYGLDIWLKVTEANLYFAYDCGVRRVVLTDIRYPNEAEWIQNVLGGKVYRIEGRGDTTSTAAAEVALDGFTGFAGYLDNRPGRELAVMADLRQQLAVDFGLVRR